MENVADKVLLVTGGTRGIGYHCAEEALRQGAKAVAILGMNATRGVNAAAKLEKEFGKGRVIFLACDITNHELFKECFNKVIQTFGGLDILVNNAAALKENDLLTTVNTNIIAMVRCCYLALEYMGKHKGGKGGTILNMASIVSFHPITSVPIYTATKHAILGFSRSIQGFYEKTGVRVLVLCPGLTPTDLAENAFEQLPEFVDEEGANQERSILPPQTLEDVGRSFVRLLQIGKNGSIWVIEGGKSLAVNIPHYSKFSVPV